MATQVPAKLKAADVQRFMHRAQQLEKFKPAIAYWCKYQALNQILSKGLQNADDECMAFATKVMDNIEQMKIQNADDPAITDETIAQAFIQQFGVETFERGDKAIRANSVSAKTVDTFQAAVTFLDLLQIWGPPNADTVSKIKYAKFHAVRIAKAVKAGEDPNASNPVPEPIASPDQVALDPSDPEVQKINQAASQQPTVEDALDDADGSSSFQQPSALPLRPPSAPGVPRPRSADAPVSFAPPPQPDPTMSPLGHASAEPSPLGTTSSNPRKDSAGGGYFPEVDTPSSIPPTALHAPASTSPSETAAHTFYQNAPPSTFPSNQPSAPPSSSLHPTNNPAFVPPHVSSPQPHQPQPHFPPPAPLSTAPSAVSSAPITANGQYNTDDVAVTDAQKHARWAISALNFEDVPTAVKELRIALRALGAG